MDETEVKSGADSFRPLSQIMNDLKKIDSDMATLERHRARLLSEMKQLGNAATQYAENYEQKLPKP